ncbi:MAG: hypothetical protein ACRENE_19670 [Polyangiaceae bacterium]
MAAGLAASLLVACASPDRHVVLGQRYDVAANCLQPTSSIDIVEGSDPGLTCSATCVVTPSGVVYASTECGSFPSLDDTSGADPRCAGALAALINMTLCGAGDDGGDDAADAADAAETGPMDAPLEGGSEATPEAAPEGD